MKKNLIVLAIGLVIVSAALLIGVYIGTEDLARSRQESAINEVVMRLLPGSDGFTQEDYSGEDENITAVYKSDLGYVIQSKAQGYVNEITLLVGVRNDGRVSGITVLDMAETDGLGQQAMTDTDYLGQYLGTSGNAEVGSNIDAITGATVTSKAITRAVNTAVAYVTGADVASSATEWSG